MGKKLCSDLRSPETNPIRGSAGFGANLFRFSVSDIDKHTRLDSIIEYNGNAMAIAAPVVTKREETSHPTKYFCF